jgi:hypothetical protein
MTPLTRIVRRKTRLAYVVLYAGKARPIVVSLLPGDVISFREAGRRQCWSLPLDRVFRHAVKDAARGQKRSSK